MRRIISILIHLALLNFIELGFNSTISIIFTITFTISVLTLIWDPIVEAKHRADIRRTKTKNKIKIENAKTTKAFVEWLHDECPETKYMDSNELNAYATQILNDTLSIKDKDKYKEAVEKVVNESKT